MALVGISTGVLGFVKNPAYIPRTASTEKQENEESQLSPEAEKNRQEFLEKIPEAENTIDFNKNKELANELEYRLTHASSGYGFSKTEISSSNLYNNDLQEIYTALKGTSNSLQSAKDTMSMIERRETIAQDTNLSGDEKFVNNTYLRALDEVLQQEVNWTQDKSNWSADSMVRGNNTIYGSNGRTADSLAKSNVEEILGDLTTESLGMENFFSMNKEDKVNALDKATQVLNEKSKAFAQLYEKRTGETLTYNDYVPISKDKLAYAESSRVGGGMRIMDRTSTDLSDLPGGFCMTPIDILV